MGNTDQFWQHLRQEIEHQALTGQVVLHCKEGHVNVVDLNRRQSAAMLEQALQEIEEGNTNQKKMS